MKNRITSRALAQEMAIMKAHPCDGVKFRCQKSEVVRNEPVDRSASAAATAKYWPTPPWLS